MSTTTERPVTYEGTRIPSRVPTVLDVPAELRDSEDVLQVNFGPNHPSTHGVLRLIVDLHGEEVVGVSAVIGYLHTGFEKSMESKTYWKASPIPERIDYVGYQNNELVFVLAVEQLLELETPTKAKWMRMLLCELNRIHSHLVYLGTSALELGAISMFWYCFRERETILDLFELVTGQRMHTRYFQVGGLAEDIPQGFYPECRKFVEWMPHALDDYKRHPRPQRDLARADGGHRRALRAGRDRARADRPEPPRLGRRLGSAPRPAVPPLRAGRLPGAGLPEGRRLRPLSRAAWTRWRSRTRSCASASTSSSAWRGMPWIADDRKVVLPPREELHTSMESLIHHFKIVTEGFRVPAGEIYVAIESPRGESGCYLVSDGGPKPWRVHFRAPSFVALEATATCLHHALVADLIAVVGSLDAVMGDTDR